MEISQSLPNEEKRYKEGEIHGEQVYARFLGICRSELSLLAFLRLRADSPGQSGYTLAKAVDSSVPLDELRNRGSRIRRVFKSTLSETEELVQENAKIHPANPNNEAFYYSISPLGKSLQGTASFFLKGVMDVNEQHGTNLTLSDILTKSAQGAQKAIDEDTLPPTKRAFYIRAKILEAVHTFQEGEPLRSNPLAKNLGVAQETVLEHLTNAREVGLVTLDSSSPERKGDFTYMLVPGAQLPREPQKSKHMATDVDELFLEHARQIFVQNPTASLDAHSLVEILYPLYTEKRIAQDRAPIAKERLEINISALLARLSREGVLSPKYIVGDHRFIAALTPQGRAIVNVLLKVKETCINASLAKPLEENYPASFPLSPAETHQLLQSVESRSTQRLPEAGRMQTILDILANHPEGPGLRPGEASDIIGIDVHTHLTTLAHEGILEQSWGQSQKGKGRGLPVHYSLTPQAKAILSKDSTISYEELRKRIVAS